MECREKGELSQYTKSVALNALNKEGAAEAKVYILKNMPQEIKVRIRQYPLFKPAPFWTVY